MILTIIGSGGKAYYTYFINDACEWTRLSCGGHGFAHYSGLPAQFFDNAPNVTLEGENQIMFLQMARFLLKVVNWSTKSPSRVPYHFSYIKDLQSLTTQPVQATTDEELSSPATLFRLLQQNAAVTLNDTLLRL
jgi:acyl-CoA oxidase